MAKQRLKIKRRHFLGGSLLLGTGSLHLPGSTLMAASCPRQHKLPAVLHEMCFQTEARQTDAYLPPRRQHATADYLDSLSEEDFLRRHGFA